ncbi:hypothetical protein SAMN04489761_3360 [Tenacibaculum sp. MAR_2009_124]|uniref:type II toxin-antitoxin system RelE/ParE family toxin n=1 Tax=Tenacibaculum sp. MAR_2009_124 TaxID=1250059 RepID=UPI0008983D6E|nr:type II toxin-antitoxin system RelE/ParE family toxin [Tenacibaculum sp. MAR_2009_124]SEC57238.1 hypothetical protein SAMN04489761_3360 [Tenacibaculum sp. MAR_2009_124]
MSYTIKLLPVVYKDLQKAKKWYNNQREDLGEEFKLEVNKEFAYIKGYPEQLPTEIQRITSIFSYSFSLRYILFS